MKSCKVSQRWQCTYYETLKLANNSNFGIKACKVMKIWTRYFTCKILKKLMDIAFKKAEFHCMASYHVNICNYETVDHFMRHSFVRHWWLQIAPNLCGSVLRDLLMHIFKLINIWYSTILMHRQIQPLCVSLHFRGYWYIPKPTPNRVTTFIPSE